jgi:ATP-dependent exoDNAse (exonuclease V) alpha subunit
MSPLELSQDFNHALNLIEIEKKNLFVTGRAGTGKSTLLQLFRNTTKKKHIVLAPTGVAALNVRGQTIHSFFNFPPRLFNPNQIRLGKNKKLIQELDVIIIDEISMVRADLMDAMDYVLRVMRNNKKPFGGIQMVVFGDLFQLPPVVTQETYEYLTLNGYSSAYFFSAHLFTGFPDFFEMFELHKIYRQDNKLFIALLEAVRLNRIDRDELDVLNERCQPTFASPDNHITLCARNYTADKINQTQLSLLAGDSKIYTAKITGNFQPSQFPTDPVLHLKVGAQVMILRNDPEGTYVNGSIGVIQKLEENEVELSLEENGIKSVVSLSPLSWEILQYKLDNKNPNKISTETIGTFTQIPLRLAWGVTIHKAQGKTFDKIIIDLAGGAFEHGHTYVALSRCKSLEGIVLRHLLKPADLKTDPVVLDYYRLFA